MSFQSNAFQSNAFQMDAGVTPTPTAGGGKPGRAGRKRRLQVQIDAEVFEVASEVEAVALLTRAREMACTVAAEALAKAPRRLKLPPPKIRIVAPDYGDAWVQQLQAQIEATRAAIADVYRQAALDARTAQQAAVAQMQRALRIEQAAEADDEEALMALLL